LIKELYFCLYIVLLENETVAFNCCCCCCCYNI